MSPAPRTPLPARFAGKPARRGIYILPNLFTTAGLFSGFYAIVLAINGQFEYAPLAIYVAMVFDALDGRVARWTHTESDFGAQYDSLSDMVTFGLAPALLMYSWALSGLGKLGWLAAFVYAACAGLRLARFNTQVGQEGDGFQGLPSPAAAAVVSGFVWVMMRYGVPGESLSLFALLFTVLAAAAMVSNIHYFSLKKIDLRARAPFIAVLAVVLAFVLVSLDPPQILFAAFLVYAVSGPLVALWRRHHPPVASRPPASPDRE